MYFSTTVAVRLCHAEQARLARGDGHRTCIVIPSSQESDPEIFPGQRHVSCVDRSHVPKRVGALTVVVRSRLDPPAVVPTPFDHLSEIGGSRGSFGGLH
ncbi:hypothetical protein [Mycolicibacterium llatzerense]|uniref:hypothetical protein n=1 Tax=Mycolicibacterium llatzerense TaxID=280871 RepID=UPI0021B5BFF9|nr:hypothetical protein [Mycolicibacterium llatzerense]